MWRWMLSWAGVLALARVLALTLLFSGCNRATEIGFRSGSPLDALPGNATGYLREPVGVDTVWVEGETIVKGGAYTDARPGRIV